MRRSRRLSGLEPPRVPEVLKPAPRKRAQKAASKKKQTATSSSKKENTRPTSTKRNASATRARSQKRTTPKKKATPKKTAAAPPASARSRSRGGAASKKKAATRSRSAKRASSQKRKTPKKKASAKKSTTTIHRDERKATPASRTVTDETEGKTTEFDAETFPPPPLFDDLTVEDEDETYLPGMDDEYLPPKGNWGVSEPSPTATMTTSGHSMDLTMFGVVLLLIVLYMMSFCRAMSCAAVTKLPWISSMLVDFDTGATVMTSFVMYIVSLGYCRAWLKTDGYSSNDEGSFVTLHFVHGLLVVLHLVSCSIVSPNAKQTDCTDSIVALSMGFYGAAWAMQLKFSMEFLRNSLALAYVCTFYYRGMNAFGVVLMLAAKSVFWMTSAHMTEVINNERWAMIDIFATVGCVFLAYLVPLRV